MDQFDEINKHNNRILKVIFSIPIIVIIFIIAIFIYFLPTVLKFSKIYKIQEEYMLDDEITEGEIEYYISGLETDEKIMNSNSLLYNQDYNLSLMDLYTMNGDYDKVIARFNKVSEVDENPFYDFYAGMAYFQKKDFDNCLIEMNRVLEFNLDKTFYTEMEYIGLQETLDNTKDLASLIIDFVDFIKLAKEKDSFDDFSSKEISSYINTWEEFYDLSGEYDTEVNVLLLELYLKIEDYDNLIDRANLFITYEDVYLYHYYLGYAYYAKESNRELVIDEFLRYLNRESSQSFKLDTLEKSMNAKIILANAYYDKNNLGESLKFVKEYTSEKTTLFDGDEEEVLKQFNSIVGQRQDYSTYLLDSDQDGLSDDLENLLGLNKDEIDTDGDSYTDKQEFLAGHNPFLASPEDFLTDEDYCSFYISLRDYPS